MTTQHTAHMTDIMTDKMHQNGLRVRINHSDQGESTVSVYAEQLRAPVLVMPISEIREMIAELSGLLEDAVNK